MLRFSYRRIVMPPDGATDADVWAYLESFLVHYRNLLDFFGNQEPRKTDLNVFRGRKIFGRCIMVPIPTSNQLRGTSSKCGRKGAGPSGGV